MIYKYRLFSPKSKSGTKISDSTKAHVRFMANKLVETVLKPKFIEPPPIENNWNYVADIYTKWHGRYFYFLAKYNCLGPNAIEPSFEKKSARLEYLGSNRFNLGYMRHNGKWAVVGMDMTLEACLDDIEKSGFYYP